MRKQFSGILVPMITPFRETGDLDHLAAKKISAHLASNGASPVLFGTTGEGPSISKLDMLEIRRFIETVVSSVEGKVPVYVAISDQSLMTSKTLARECFSLGVSAVIAHVPTYYPCKPEAIKTYFNKLVENIKGPLLLYNIPLTTHVSISLDVIDELSYHPSIIGIKDSDGDALRLQKSLKAWKSRLDFSYFCGSEGLALEAYRQGADGLVPSTGNIFPKTFVEMHETALQKRFDETAVLFDKMQEISQIYLKNRTLDQSLSALKTVMHILGFCTKVMLPPLFSTSNQEEEKIRKELERNKLLSSCF